MHFSIASDPVVHIAELHLLVHYLMFECIDVALEPLFFAHQLMVLLEACNQIAFGRYVGGDGESRCVVVSVSGRSEGKHSSMDHRLAAVCRLQHRCHQDS